MVAAGGFDDMVFELIRVSQMDGWTSELVEAARATSKNRKVRELETTLRLINVEGDAKLVKGSLERTVREKAGFADFVPWAEKLMALRHRICRIEYPTPQGTGYGTGFLVANDLVMTNYHVVEYHIKGKLTPDHIVCRFDYAVEKGAENKGIEVQLDRAKWTLGSSPYSSFDPGDRGGSPAPNELDFAVLKLSRVIGAEEIDGEQRGYVRLSNLPDGPDGKDVLFIVQHPKGDPLKLAVGVVLGNNSSKTRLRYDANTEPGSSGSPCLNGKLELVALHHGGDPDYFRPAQYNQGIPIGLILSDLRNRQDFPRAWG
jgi:hypothetical protein